MISKNLMFVNEKHRKGLGINPVKLLMVFVGEAPRSVVLNLFGGTEPKGVEVSR